MADLSTIRRRNLLLALAEFSQRELAQGRSGSALAFAELLQIHPTLLSKLRGASGKGSRDVSDQLARQVESRLSLSSGWMDEERTDAPMTPAETSFLDLALRAYRAGDAKTRRALRRELERITGVAGREPS